MTGSIKLLGCGLTSINELFGIGLTLTGMLGKTKIALCEDIIVILLWKTTSYAYSRT